MITSSTKNKQRTRVIRIISSLIILTAICFFVVRFSIYILKNGSSEYNDSHIDSIIIPADFNGKTEVVLSDLSSYDSTTLSSGVYEPTMSDSMDTLFDTLFSPTLSLKDESTEEKLNLIINW